MALAQTMIFFFKLTLKVEVKYWKVVEKKSVGTSIYIIFKLHYLELSPGAKVNVAKDCM